MGGVRGNSVGQLDVAWGCGGWGKVQPCCFFLGLLSDRRPKPQTSTFNTPIIFLPLCGSMSAQSCLVISCFLSQNGPTRGGHQTGVGFGSLCLTFEWGFLEGAVFRARKQPIKLAASKSSRASQSGVSRKSRQGGKLLKKC